MKKYNLHLIKFKVRTIKNKKKNEIIEVDYFDKITFDLAKYLAIKDGCALRFLNKKGKVCLKNDAIKSIGYNHYEKILAIIHPELKYKKILNDISIYPNIKKQSLNKKMINWNRFKKLFDDYENNFFDYSIEADKIWGPASLIPKNYKQAIDVVKEGDYVFSDGSWLSVSVSFSPIKIGEKIEETGCIYSGKHKGRVFNETLTFYNKFIIRKSG